MKTPLVFPAMIAATLSCSVLLNPGRAAAQEIGFAETFALAENREEALKQLIPGTEDYYYYHALHYQNEGQFDKVDALFDPWVKRFNETPQVVEMRNRQALLRYSNDPAKTLEYLRQRLGTNLGHQQEIPDKVPDLPGALDPNAISRAALLRDSFNRAQGLEPLEDAALEWLARDGQIELTPLRRKQLLARLTRPDFPGLAAMILEDFKTKESRGFGEYPIHAALLPEQLKELLAAKPDLARTQAFVDAWISKLRPSEDVDAQNDPEVREAYLKRLWEYVSGLDPAFNSLKAHVLYRLLDHYRGKGEYPKDMLMSYLALPRRGGIVNPKAFNENTPGQHFVDPNADYARATLMPPVGSDDALIRDYLLHLFVKEENYDAYAKLLLEDWVKPVFAEAKIVNGIGDQEKWYAYLNPAAYQALKDRVDIDFAPENAKEFGAGDAVTLAVDVKNVSKLIVKVYEVNALNYYLDHGSEIGTDLNLDGLVANEESASDYAEPPLRRVRRTFDFPQLKDQRGVWVIEMIGNGRSSRALVRKGGLQFLSATASAGTVITVLDGNNAPAKDPAVWLGGRRHTPGKSGSILVPFSNNPGRVPLVLTDGDFATLEYLDHSAESYDFSAGFHVERETLLPRKDATVVIRPILQLAGQPVSLGVLKDVRLAITSTDIEGVQTTSEALGVTLFDDREATHTFRVPDRLRSLDFTLYAKVDVKSQGTTRDVAASGHFELNGINASQQVEALHLVPVPGGYVVDLLGKSGEPRTDRAVAIEVKHRDFRETVKTSLKTDGVGRVTLGALTDIAWVRATAPSGQVATWFLREDTHSRPGSLHGKAGEALALPAMGSAAKPTREEFALLETRGGVVVADKFDALSLEGGFLRITGLEAGDYVLSLKEEKREIAVRVTAGEAKVGRYLLSDVRHLEVVNPAALQVTEVAVGEKEITLKLANVKDKFTRVHVMATRYLPEYPVESDLGNFAALEPSVIRRGFSGTQYVSGRDIGDEYRYILSRRSATIYPGNMLARPGLLLNPWELRTTETEIAEAQAGEEYARLADMEKAARKAGARPGAKLAGGQAEAGNFVSLDFLKESAPVAFNLVPDNNGVVRIPAASLGDRHCLQVLAVDPENTVFRSVVLPEKAVAIRDLRLLNGLDPKKHLTELDQTAVLRQGEKATIDDVLSAKVESYDSLDAVYRLLTTVSGNNATLAEFRFLLDWPTMKPEDKRAKYSEFSCHELNFFLSRRDPEFFATVVKPYLANKKDKTFLDEYLLGSDLSRYLEPYRYARLNVVEQILLARRIGGDEAAATARHVGDLDDLTPPDPEGNRRLFEFAIAGLALEADGEVTEGESLSRRSLGRLMEKKSEMLREELAAAEPESDAAAPPAPGAPAAERGAMARNRADEKGKEMADKQAGLAGKDALKRDGSVDRFASLGDDAGGMNGIVTYDFVASDMDGADPFGGEVRQYFRKMEPTKEWAENNYYHLLIEQQNAELVKANPFWRDYASWNGEGLFLSPHFSRAAGNFTEIMFALSVLDLPYTAGEHTVENGDASLAITAASPVIIFHRQTREAPISDDKTPVLVSQNFYRDGDRYRNEGNERLDKFVTEEFLTGVVYGCEVVVTNPSSSVQKLDVLVQVPHFALPVGSVRYTQGRNLRLDPYGTSRFDFFFYFPKGSGNEAGFAQFPVHVAKAEQIIAWGDPFAFKVVDVLSKIDTAGWDYISQMGSADEVIAFLEANNLFRLNLDRMAWRMRDAAFFKRAITLLNARHLYQHTLYGYALVHNDPKAVGQYLLHSDGFLNQSGSYLDTELVRIDPVERKSYQHLEYSPLVNARAHTLGAQRKILNTYLHGQYHRFMDILCHKAKLDDEDAMTVTYYLFLQDRIEEGLGFFAKVDAEKLPTRLQHDYFRCHVAFYGEKPKEAATIAASYAEYPVDRWQNLFAQVASQAKEIEGGAAVAQDEKDREQQQDVLADTEPTFDFKVENKEVTVTYRNLEAATVNYYLMDLEFLFSSNPFVGSDSSRFSIVKPNQSAALKLPKGKDKLAFALPKEFQGSNVLVEIVAAGRKQAAAYYANSLKVQVVENYGRVDVSDAATGKPLPKTYVKVYAELGDGSTKFYKDGYTDLRGKFDYLSLNTGEIDGARRFALLVMSPEHGALVKEAKPPQR